MKFPTAWKNKSHVPNHQPVMSIVPNLPSTSDIANQSDFIWWCPHDFEFGYLSDRQLEDNAMLMVICPDFQTLCRLTHPRILVWQGIILPTSQTPSAHLKAWHIPKTLLDLSPPLMLKFTCHWVAIICNYPMNHFRSIWTKDNAYSNT